MDVICVIYDYIIINFIWVLTILIQWVIAYHVYYLSKKIWIDERLQHEQTVSSSIRYIRWDSYKGIDSSEFFREVLLVNKDNYYTKYPDNEHSIFSAHTHEKVELMGLSFDWVECIMKVEELYETNWGNLSFIKRKWSKPITALKVWIVEYNNIYHIDQEWDEFSYRPKIFCSYIWDTRWYIKLRRLRLTRLKTPFIRYRYYKKNWLYKPWIDPYHNEYTLINSRIQDSLLHKLKHIF